MELVTKVIDPLKHFWVEKYNDEAKQFFLDLGFKEKQYGGFKPTFNLEFPGSGVFGFWSKEERIKIFGAVGMLRKKDKKLFEWDGYFYEQNPFELF